MPAPRDSLAVVFNQVSHGATPSCPTSLAMCCSTHLSSSPPTWVLPWSSSSGRHLPHSRCSSAKATALPPPVGYGSCRSPMPLLSNWLSPAPRRSSSSTTTSCITPNGFLGKGTTSLTPSPAISICLTPVLLPFAHTWSPPRCPQLSTSFPYRPSLCSPLRTGFVCSPGWSSCNKYPPKARWPLWRKWESFLTTIGLANDPFLKRFDAHHQTRLLCCFASTSQKNGPDLQSISGQARATVQEGSIRAALDALASTYWENELLSPTYDNAGHLNYLLRCQLKGFKNSDPSPTPQKAVSPTVIRAIASGTNTPLDRAIDQLVVGAFFFTMHSWEYSSVSGECRTKLLKHRNIRFYKNNSELSAASTFLQLADCVAIPFFFQKNEQRNKTITVHQTQDPTQCPICSWAAVCYRIHEYPDATPSTPINAYIHPMICRNYSASHPSKSS